MNLETRHGIEGVEHTKPHYHFTIRTHSHFQRLSLTYIVIRACAVLCCAVLWCAVLLHEACIQLLARSFAGLRGRKERED
ncbi:hypothetical protein E2C01_086382 [Portunus trituberculatus]|uniref:Uncharacterized protein n=1 Tax=Portunus trituberculatus TaxID=210409 RepID=A0A5B7JA58_PORTR|nr:hypothetical protein [Portunus trituberculatus]